MGDWLGGLVAGVVVYLGCQGNLHVDTLVEGTVWDDHVTALCSDRTVMGAMQGMFLWIIE